MVLLESSTAVRPLEGDDTEEFGVDGFSVLSILILTESSTVCLELLMLSWTGATTSDEEPDMSKKGLEKEFWSCKQSVKFM